MTDVVLATHNEHKAKEFREIFGSVCPDIRILTLSDIGHDEEIEENGATFEENAIIKASVPASFGYIGIADDSGLAVDFLGGDPGVRSARYAGLGCDSAACREKLLKVMKGVPENERGAGFVCVMALCLPEGSGLSVPADLRISRETAERSGRPAEMTAVVRGECRGSITDKEYGDLGFGYDPVFFSPEFGKTFGELAADEKNSISHRGRAAEKFAAVLSRVLK